MLNKVQPLMKKLSLNNKGFGLVGVLLVILVLAAAGGTGAYVYHKNHKAKTSTTTSNSSSSSKTSNNSSTTTQGSNSTQNQQSHLTIKEWGVKLPLSDAIKDAYYVVSTSSQDANGQPNTMWLGLTSLNSKGCNAALANQGQSTQLGALLRVSPTETDPVSGTPYKQLYPNGVTIGNYYYAYKSWTKNKTCASQSQLQAIDSAFANAAKSAVVATN